MPLLARLSRLVFVAASLLWLVGDGHAKEASLIAYCQSVNLSKGTASVAGTLLDAYFTTFDGSAGLPLYDTLGNFLVVSGELSPNPAAAGNHRTDYLLFANGVPNATGTASVNFPTTDADGNGVADFLQIAQAGSVAFNGTVTRQTPTAAPAQAMTGQISRAAGSSTGSYVAYLQDPVAGTVTYRGTSYLLNAQGGLTYDRTSNTAVITVKVSNEDGTTTTYSGGGKFVVVDANTVSFPAITYSGSNARVLQAKPFTLTRSGRRYLGNTEFQDGGLSTTWRDYIQWRTEITDNNDVDANGIPDFSDNVLVAPSITAQPQPVTVTVGQAVQFSVTATGTAPLSYQWQRNTQNISGATGATYAIVSAQLANAGDYRVVVGNAAGNVTSSVTTLTVMPVVVVPSITIQPQSLIVTQGQAAQFSVTAVGTAPLSYQWQKDGQNILGANAAVFTITSVQSANGGSYRVVVSNSAGSVTSSTAALTTKAAVFAPTIATQPVSSAVSLGQQLVLSVQASGSAPLGYQWQKAGVNLVGATAAQLTLKSVTLSDAGEYRVVVSSSAGSITSTVAVVAVVPANTAPVITSQPVGVSIGAGQPLELTVVATGIPNPRYQWQRNGVDLAGATDSVLRKLSASIDDSGSYQVLVFNTVGQVLSTKVTVTVESVGPKIPVAKLNIRLVPEVTILGEINSQWSLEWASSLTPEAPWFALTNFTLAASGSQVIDLSETQPGRYYRSIGGYVGVPASMSVIPTGPFQMGAEVAGSSPVHTVNVSKFVIDRYEVSKTLWDTVRNWAITRNYNLPAGSSFAGPLQPVHSVNWYDAIKWCNARSEMEGIAPVYYLDVGLRTVYRSGESLPYLKKNTGYRLPTEAEWEKAARGGYYGQEYPWPENISINPGNANYIDSQMGQTTAVSSYPANGYGIYNISGNVWEWCWDYYGAYLAGNQTDPQGVSQGNARVIRGGGWDNADNFCRVFSRISNGTPTSRGNSIGFRTVRSGQ